MNKDDVTKPASVDALTGPRIGPYRVIREIGRGGMGTVHLAVRSGEFLQRVAIKVLARGMDSEAIVRRFRNERQILANLQHPYIAALLDGGTTPDGQPYFAMEYVEGQPIVEYCEARQLDTTARLELFRKVCAAVQHAHQNLVIHRDIKPANVLVTAGGTPKLLDFGIAKLLNPVVASGPDLPTMAGPALMTPEYASPEQVRGDAVTTASDVYSLGVLLYELLTGRRPYRLTSRAPAEVARVVCHAIPDRPSTAVTRGAADSDGDAPTGAPVTGGMPLARFRAPAAAERLRRLLEGDLDNIVLKALSKEPARRYASVDQFSEDIRRHLVGLPVAARQDTWRYRAAKFVGRNRAAVSGALLGVLVLLGGIVATTWQVRVAQRERQLAEQRFTDVRHLANALLFDLHDAIRDLPGSTPARQVLVSKGREYLDKLARDVSDRPDLNRELAAAYVRVGDVQGRPFNPNLGDTAGALASYRKAVGLYDALRAEGSGDPALLREAGTAYLRMSEALAPGGDTNAALGYVRRAVAALQAAAMTAASSEDAAVPPELRRDLVAGYSRLGDLLSASGDTAGALEQRRLALGLMETLAASDATSPDTLRQLASAHQKLGNNLGNPNYPNVGDHQGAFEALERAAAVLRKAVEIHPNNALFARNLAIVDSNASDVLTALKRPEAALERQHRARATFERLSAADPTNAAAVNDLAISMSKIAEMLDAGGRTREAVADYERALAMHQRLSSADPENTSLRLEVASDHNRLATAQAKLGWRDPALEHHGRAVSIARELEASNQGNVELGVALALALAGRGDAFAAFARRSRAPWARIDDLVGAERDYSEAVDLLAGLEQRRAIAGTDLTTLENARRELARLRREIGSRTAQ